jgi:hypothetical protein
LFVVADGRVKLMRHSLSGKKRHARYADTR